MPRHRWTDANLHAETSNRGGLQEADQFFIQKLTDQFKMELGLAILLQKKPENRHRRARSTLKVRSISFYRPDTRRNESL